MKKLIVIFAVVLSACSSTPPPQPSYSSMNNHSPMVHLRYEGTVNQMGREETIQAIRQCTDSGLRAEPIYAKRNVAGNLSNIIIDVNCVPMFFFQR